MSDSLARLNVTRVVIAQRLSTVMKADRLYAMDGGRIVESGAYRAVMAANGLFATLAHRQLT